VQTTGRARTINRRKWDEGELTLETRVELEEPAPSFGKAYAGFRTRLAGRRFLVDEKNTAVCDGGEGELPFKIEPGERVPYLEGVLGGGMGTLEYDEDGPVLFAGRFIPLGALSLDEDSLARVKAHRTAPRAASRFDCPNCGGSLALRTGKDAEMIVCEFCDTRIDLREGKYRPLGKAVRAGPRNKGLKIGMKGTLQGIEWQVVGRLRYRDITPSHW